MANRMQSTAKPASSGLKFLSAERIFFQTYGVVQAIISAAIHAEAADLRCPSICLLNLFCYFCQAADNMAAQSCHKMIMDSESCFVRQSSSPEDDRRAFRHRYTGLPSDEP